AVGRNTVFVPGGVWGYDKIIDFKRDFIAIDDGIAAFAFHNKPQCGRFVSVCRCAFAGAGDLDPGVEPSYGGTDVFSVVVYEINDSAASLFGSHELGRFYYEVAQVVVFPQHWN